MQNFISFLMVLIFFEKFEIFFRVRCRIYQKCPFKGQSSLAGVKETISLTVDANKKVKYDLKILASPKSSW